jgi:4a-hydroxytetrahydrobiopterin dehydratase
MADKKPTPTTRLKPERLQSKLKSERVQDQLRPERLGSQLKSERVQSRLKPERVQTRLRPERIQAQLEELPGWELAGKGRALERTYLFPTIRAAVAFVALVAEIGEAEGYVPDVDLRHLEVTLRVATSTEAGVTELDFDVARIFALLS